MQASKGALTLFERALWPNCALWWATGTHKTWRFDTPDKSKACPISALIRGFKERP